MYSETTPAVARALQRAPRWAAALGAGAVEPVHIILALLDEEEGRAARLFEEAHLTRAVALQQFGRGIIPAEGIAPELPYSSLSKNVLRQALVLAAHMEADRTINSEAILLATLREDRTLRASLEALGLHAAQLEGALASAHESPIPMDEQLQIEETVEAVATARALDAGANRAREALRVIEDHCRFVHNDAALTEQLKQLRHDLTDVLHDLLPRELGLAARDTNGDVGTAITTPQERQRHSLLDVVEANLKRLQEALRSLEEFAKISSPAQAGRIEQLRYRAYTLEKALLMGAETRRRFADFRLYVLLSGESCIAAMDWTIKEAAAGGAQVFQLREKQLDDRALIDRARRMRRWTHEAGAGFIVNDRPDIARLVDADGVHLGQEDMSVQDARRIMGADAIIGVSTHSIEQLQQALCEGITYAAVGPVFSSRTKNFEALAGLNFVRKAAGTTDVPLFAIGGINSENAGQVMAAGIERLAVSQAICGSDHPREAAQQLRRQIDAAWRALQASRNSD